METSKSDLEAALETALSSKRRLYRTTEAATLSLEQGMVIRGFRIDSNEATIEEYGDDDDEDALIAAAKSDTDISWLDVDGSGDDHEWIDKLGLGAFVSNELYKPFVQWHPHVLSTRKRVLLKLRTLPVEEISSYPVPHYSAAVISQHLLLTWNTSNGGGTKKGPTLSQQGIAYLTQEEDVLLAGSPSAALIAWIDFHLGRTLNAMMQLRSSSRELVQKMDDEPSSVPLLDIMEFKNILLGVLAVAEEQSQCMNMMKKIDKDNACCSAAVDFTKLRGALNILVSSAESTERMGSRLEKRSISLRQQYDSCQQDRMNHRLAVLTVLSAVFMPLTFIAGIYGMNFENMPELGYENSYFILLGTLIVIAISMISFFVISGWFA